jgi:hypothetical protein
MGELGHGGSRKNLLGTDAKPELVELFSNEKQVNEKTPPMFLAHAIDDKPVNPEHSRRLHAALEKAGVATEYLELPGGGHGLDGYKGPHWDAWQAAAIKWLAAQKMIPDPRHASRDGRPSKSEAGGGVQTRKVRPKWGRYCSLFRRRR